MPNILPIGLPFCLGEDANFCQRFCFQLACKKCKRIANTKIHHRHKRKDYERFEPRTGALAHRPYKHQIIELNDVCQRCALDDLHHEANRWRNRI